MYAARWRLWPKSSRQAYCVRACSNSSCPPWPTSAAARSHRRGPGPGKGGRPRPLLALYHLDHVLCTRRRARTSWNSYSEVLLRLLARPRRKLCVLHRVRLSYAAWTRARVWSTYLQHILQSLLTLKREHASCLAQLDDIWDTIWEQPPNEQPPLRLARAPCPTPLCLGTPA